MKTYTYLLIISRCIILGMGNVSSKSCTENQNVHFTCSIFTRKSDRSEHKSEKHGTVRSQVEIQGVS